MNNEFDAQHFSVTDKSIILLRNRFAYREIKPTEIKKIELTKGIDIKRPIISVMFGVFLFAIAIYLLVNFSGFRTDDLYGGPKTAKAIGYSILMIFFFLGLSGYSIYKSLPIHSVIKLTMTSGKTESLGIDRVIKDKKIDALLTSLKSIGVANVIVKRHP